jgi:hypothetical protein
VEVSLSAAVGEIDAVTQAMAVAALRLLGPAA